jgi:predicted MPP superfamily phosphohydrolase
MPFALDVALALAAFLGHFSLAVWCYNRLHAVAWPVRLIKFLDRTLLVGAAVVLAAWIIRTLLLGRFVGAWSLADPWTVYACFCWSAALLVPPLWLLPKLLERTPAALVANDTEVVDVAQRLGARPIAGTTSRMLAVIPGNQACQLHIHRKTLRLPQLPDELDGLTIAHLSDLHMIGNLTEPFYDQVVAATNALNPDLICISGDILEKTGCLPWIGRTLGKLQARHGKFFILGNHELRLPDARVLRESLVAAGLTDLGSRCESIAVSGCQILLAGNELPWFGHAPKVPSSFRNPHSAFRILLAHTPDQFQFAQSEQYDLLLAGHTHGGQIRLPGLGALISPSWHGWRYASGLFHEPPTVMHVSRGISGKEAIRLHCPPEIALLILTTSGQARSGEGGSAGASPSRKRR